MVVLAASICTRSGKAIISRQFREMTKERVTALLAAFPSLLGDSAKHQHTTVEDEHVRYVYQPLEELYVVLITNRQSNILQDIDTLHLFTQTITSLSRSIDEREIFDNCFEILSAFDEIINLGYKENLTTAQVLTFLEMDSHEEKIQEIIEKNKELEATEERKRRAKEIQRKELARKNMEQFGSGFGGAGYDNGSAYLNQAQTPSYTPTPSLQQHQQYAEPAPQRVAPPRAHGLQLGKKPARPLDGVSQPLLVEPLAQPVKRQQPQEQSPVKEKTPNNGILITISEKVSAQITREGEVKQSEVKGDLQLRINDASLAHSQIVLDFAKNPSTQYKTHPFVDKNLFNRDNKIGLKDATKQFPSNDQSLGVLRWRQISRQEDDTSLLPVTLSTWVNNHDDGTIGVTVEYELHDGFQKEHSLDEVYLLVPITQASLNTDENDNVQMTFVEDGVLFKISHVASKFPSGSFEFVAQADDDEVLFPMELRFELENNVDNLSTVAVGSIVSLGEDTEGEELPYDLYYNLSTEGYYVV
ncbi:unnamed protein product [Kuraishia capsulata CBS 1993]|uniref:Coatomer subunit delta n=1 Tax=Kuraishia capsulata CBS 1993 TaxID=1382522 RepID=W6MHV9_9ASCO|nr:uncharacterized protein KUCA_T00001591001 [Kuraishia capsulata CBS 1993]CDK25621.1 unnamed protein product [Kuraishia capsulata CBS 1993]